MPQPKPLFFTLILFFGVMNVEAQKNDAPIASNAPQDKVTSIDSGQLRRMDSLLAPYIAQAKSSYRAAKERYIKGLPLGEAFFVVTRIFDRNGKFEQVFIRIKGYTETTVSGWIANNLGTVKEYKTNQLISFDEGQILDWLISKPDGTEEGNFIGKYLDTLH